MAEQNQNGNDNFGAKLANDTVKAAGTVANAAKAAAQAAAGDVAGAIASVLKDENMRKAIISIVLLLCFLLAGCSMMIGSSITGAIEDISRTWSENWNEAWEQQGIISNGNAMYLWSSGWLAAGWDAITGAIITGWEAIVNTITSFFETNHTVDGRDAMNQSLAEGNDNRFSVDDYKTTVDSLINTEALVGENGALMKRIKMLRGRIEERGKQLAVEANSQYISDAIGIAIATVLYESFDNPLLYKGIGNIDVNFDMEAFQLSDIQAIKLLAAYSIQHDCDITSIDMWDLMDYAGWFDDVYTGLEISDFGLESIYQGTTETVFGSDIGGVVHVGQDATAIYQMKAPTVLFWRGNFAPQWYYEELQQIRKMNEEYYYNLNAGKTDEIAGLIPIGVTSEDDEEINTVGFTKLNTFTPYGIIDKLYTTGSATLTITHTEIEDAQIYYDEAQDQFIDSPSILDSWLAAFQTIVETTDSGNIYIRDEDGIHIYTLKNTVAGKEYYLYNPSSNTRTESISVDSDGEEIIFDHLAGDTLYEVYEITTEVIRPEPDPTPTDPTIPPIAIESIQDTGAAQSQALTETTPAITEETAPTDATDPTEDTDPPLPEIIITEMLIDSFVTGADLAAKKAYKLDFLLEVTYMSKSIDELVLDLIGLWPGSLTDTVIGSDGREYANGYKDNDLFAKTWKDVYVAPDGSKHLLEFERMQDYQYEAYMDLVKGFAETLGFDYAGLYEPDYGYGDTIVSVAQAEADYYLANNISGGARYWNICNEASGEDWGTTQPWCVCFVNACAYMCGYIGPDGCWGNFNGGSWIYSCSSFFNYMVKGGYADGHDSVSDDYKPVPGDLIFIGRSLTNGAYDHIGIVKEVKENGALITIEGNVTKGGTQRKMRVARVCDWGIQYRIGSEAYMADASGIMEQYYVVAYLHPHYPAAYNENAYYLSYTGITAATPSAKLVGDETSTILLAGVGRFRETQLVAVYGALKTSYPQLCTEAMQTAMDDGNILDFVNAWNQSVMNKRDAWKSAQLAITAKMYVRPVATEVKATSGFDWTATDMREELLWAIVTTSDKQNGLVSVLKSLCSGLDNDITDADLVAHLQANNFLTSTLETRRSTLWTSDPTNVQDCWIESIEMVLTKIDAVLSSE